MGDLPPGWSLLIVHNTPKVPTVLVRGEPMMSLGRLKWQHDKTICPTHTRTLDDLLTWADPGSEADPFSMVAGRA